jgi:hypothetical protein
MKKFKIIDFWISTALISFFVVTYLAMYVRGTLDFEFIYAYLVVGGWHVTSMIVHAVTQTFIRPIGARYIYHWISFIALITMPLGSFWILLFVSPFMAVFYTWLCYSEIRKMNQRPLDVLK